MFHEKHGARRFENEAQFKSSDDGKWVDNPAKIGTVVLPDPSPAETPATVNTEDDGVTPPDPGDDIETLIERAKELGIRGNIKGMKRETLVAKIIEAEEAE